MRAFLSVAALSGSNGLRRMSREREVGRAGGRSGKIKRACKRAARENQRTSRKLVVMNPRGYRCTSNITDHQAGHTLCCSWPYAVGRLKHGDA